MREVDCSRWTMDADTNKKNHLNPKNNNPLLTYLLYLLYQTLLVHRSEKQEGQKRARTAWLRAQQPRLLRPLNWPNAADGDASDGLAHDAAGHGNQ